MKRTLFVSLSFVAACCIAACSTGSDDATPPATDDKPLRITTHTPAHIEGTFADATASVSFKSVELAPRKVDVTVRAGETEIVLNLDFARGEGSFDAKSGQLDEAQVGGMLRLIPALANALPNEETTAIDALARSLNLLSVVTPSTALPTFKFVAENGWAYIQCKCQWQDSQGYHNWAGWGESCGGNHCPGRCGKGCGPDNLAWSNVWASGKYTADCAKHDYGVGTLEAATDDYMFASDNCPHTP